MSYLWQKCANFKFYPIKLDPDHQAFLLFLSTPKSLLTIVLENLKGKMKKQYQHFPKLMSEEKDTELVRCGFYF